MIAPIFSICAASADVRSILGESPIRLYPFGLQDDNVVYPYAVWQNIDGEPENYLAQRPDADHFSLQVDCWADSVATAISVARAIRGAIEGKAYITRWGDQSRDTETKRYRYSFDVDWIVKR
ncbi:tail completion protein gp17 [Sodalis ligni]|uniref:Uncharacterized protein DUF3168 n=1 Tax=Sodalis ligni TaxID=2697027 RepID=A0A4R1NR69_9GAMM|nr:DUF3168 domain-containing protein [Sodalis ligni]TCL06910.1 uncharacterized protein DUF3168 [Sodalis ligni]